MRLPCLPCWPWGPGELPGHAERATAPEFVVNVNALPGRLQVSGFGSALEALLLGIHDAGPKSDTGLLHPVLWNMNNDTVSLRKGTYQGSGLFRAENVMAWACVIEDLGYSRLAPACAEFIFFRGARVPVRAPLKGKSLGPLVLDALLRLCGGLVFSRST